MSNPVVGAVIPSISIVDAFVNANLALVGGVETGINDGEFVKWVLHETGNEKGAAWCAAMQVKALRSVIRDKMPIPKSAEVKQITDWASKKQCLIAEPVRGAMMAFWHQKDSRGPRFAHIGCVIEVLGQNTVRTVEGNTSPGVRPGGKVVREGNGCYEKIREIEISDAFVYWWIPMGGKL